MAITLDKNLFKSWPRKAGPHKAAPRGRDAERPSQVPLRGWKDVAMRIKDDLTDDHVTVVAAGCSFFAFLAVFPSIAAIVSIYGLLVDPATVEQHFSSLASVMPGEAREILMDRLKSFSASADETLGWGAVLSVALAVWSSKKGTSALIEGLGIAYKEKDHRGFIKKTLVSIAFTLGGIITVIVSMILVILVPAALAQINLNPIFQILVQLFRWAVLVGLILGSLAIVYRYAPDRAQAKWRWVTPGSIAASVLWLIASLGFSFYVSNFGSYDKTYGSIAAVIIMMMWLYISSYIILMGAEINSQLEYQTEKDTTIGQPKPLGSRGAFYADHVYTPKSKEPQAAQTTEAARDTATEPRTDEEIDSVRHTDLNQNQN